MFRKSSIINSWPRPYFSCVRFSSSPYRKNMISWGSWIWDISCSNGSTFSLICFISSIIELMALSISMLVEENWVFYFYLFLNSLSLKLFFIVYSASKANDFTFFAMKQQILTFTLELDWERNFSTILIPFTIFCLFYKMFWIIFFSTSEMLFAGVDRVFFIEICEGTGVFWMIFWELDWYWRMFSFSFSLAAYRISCTVLLLFLYFSCEIPLSAIIF